MLRTGVDTYASVLAPNTTPARRGPTPTRLIAGPVIGLALRPVRSSLMGDFFGQLGAAVGGSLVTLWAAYSWKVASKQSAPTAEDKLFLFELLVAAAALLVTQSIQTWVDVRGLDDVDELRVQAQLGIARTVTLVFVVIVGMSSANWVRHRAYTPGAAGSQPVLSVALARLLSTLGFVLLLGVFLLNFMLPIALRA